MWTHNTTNGRLYLSSTFQSTVHTQTKAETRTHTHTRARSGVNVSQLMVTYRIQENIECCWYLHDELAMESNGI